MKRGFFAVVAAVLVTAMGHVVDVSRGSGVAQAKQCEVWGYVCTATGDGGYVCFRACVR